jgi:phage regulator Rha-like protein
MSQDVSADVIQSRIFVIRGRKVMLDFDLAQLYGLEVKQLKRAVKRNIFRFPSDFMFELTKDEHYSLRCQNGTLKRGQHAKYFPFAFTEQGIAMLSSVLNSKRAIQVNIAIMRAFVQIREILLTHKELAAKIEALELKYKNQDMTLSEHDRHIAAIFEAIKQLMAPPPEPPKRRIGFYAD